MNFDSIDSTITKYVQNQDISGGALIVRKNGNLVYQNKWGFSNIQTQQPIKYDSIYRMMSMTKPITAVGILKLMEKGLLDLDDPISKFLPQFANMKVCADKRYKAETPINKLAFLPKYVFFSMDKIRTEPANRDITIRDLLSHSSGLEQGITGSLAINKDRTARESLSQQADKYSRYVLDFQPGTGTGYSPIAGYDILARIIEVVSDMDAATYFQTEIFDPLDMIDSSFHPNEAQKSRIVRVYKRKKNRLVDVTGTKDDMTGPLRWGEGYIAGYGGLFSTITDYDHFVQMLSNGGTYHSCVILRPDTVKRMATEAPFMHLEPGPGLVWGLGVQIRQDPQKGNLPVSTGTYGWSGAYGTHFFISPADGLSCVWATNRTDLAGSDSYISAKIEELVFDLFSK